MSSYNSLSISVHSIYLYKKKIKIKKIRKYINFLNKKYNKRNIPYTAQYIEIFKILQHLDKKYDKKKYVYNDLIKGVLVNKA